MDTYQQKINECRQLVEQQLQWGNSSNWQTQDFEKLSEHIFEQTGQLLSTSTLKRIWGKVKYESRPNIATLDALAKFAGYSHWRAFENATATEAIVTHDEKEQSPYRKYTWVYFLAALAGFVLLASLAYLKRPPSLTFKNLVFKSKPLTHDLPNTVVFEYDASQSNADSVFIQQSWDRRLRQQVDKEGKIFTTTYYVPGYYKAKLILNDSIVKEQDVFIETNGWKGILDTKPKPVYLSDDAVKKKEALGFTQEQISNYYTADGEPAFFVLANVNRSFASIDSNNYQLTMQLQNTYNVPGKDVCKKTFVTILGSNSFINIPLCNKGCVGEVTLIMGNKKIPGTTNNLEAFGVDLSEKTALRCELANNIFKIFLDDVQVYAAPNPNIGRLAGVKIAFTGAGMMSGFNLTSLSK